MPDKSRIREILDNLDSNCTPEEACGDDLDLLQEVRARWEKMQRIENQVDDLLQVGAYTCLDDGTTARGGIEFPEIEGYEFRSVLGRGGMGVVFKAKHRKLNRLVALKMMLAGSFAAPLERARFRREVEAAAALHHASFRKQAATSHVLELNTQSYVWR